MSIDFRNNFSSKIMNGFIKEFDGCDGLGVLLSLFDHYTLLEEIGDMLFFIYLFFYLFVCLFCSLYAFCYIFTRSLFFRISDSTNNRLRPPFFPIDSNCFFVLGKPKKYIDERESMCCSSSSSSFEGDTYYLLLLSDGVNYELLTPSSNDPTVPSYILSSTSSFPSPSFSDSLYCVKTVGLPHLLGVISVCICNLLIGTKPPFLYGKVFQRFHQVFIIYLFVVVIYCQ
jgi:hypothetical protein